MGIFEFLRAWSFRLCFGVEIEAVDLNRSGEGGEKSYREVEDFAQFG